MKIIIIINLIIIFNDNKLRDREIIINVVKLLFYC